MDLENQIKDTFKRSMKNMLTEISNKDTLSERDVDWLVRLLDEIRQRINNLTPNRRDLQDDFNKNFDLVLIRQMLEHSAIENEDIAGLIRAVCARLQMLCAASQDQHLKNLAFKYSSFSTLGALFSEFVFDINEFIDEIEHLHKSFLSRESS